MLELIAAFALVVQDPPGAPRPSASVSAADYCRTVSERDIAAGGQGLTCAGSQPAPRRSLSDLCRANNEQLAAAGRPTATCATDEGLAAPVTLERCLTEREAGRHADCRPLLQPEADLVPALLFNNAGETPPARLQGWLDVVCGADRLAAGQTAEACQAEKSALHARAYAARTAMSGRASPANGLGFNEVFGTGVDLRSGLTIQGGRTDCASTERLSFDEAMACDRAARSARTGVGQPGDSDEREADRCQRRESAWRDEDTGDSSTSYSINCTWTSGD